MIYILKLSMHVKNAKIILSYSVLVNYAKLRLTSFDLSIVMLMLAPRVIYVIKGKLVSHATIFDLKLYVKHATGYARAK